MLKADLVMLAAPVQSALLQIDITPSEHSDRAPPMSSFVRNHQGQLKQGIDLARHREQRLILLLCDNRSSRAFLAWNAGRRSTLAHQ
jgi:hypothetical protein